MPIIAQFSTPAEAAFVQSLLEAEGITATLVDASSAVALNSIASPYRLEVVDEQREAAHLVIKDYEKDGHERAAKMESLHPAKGFPFLGILVVSSFVVGCAVFLLLLIYRITDASFVLGDNWRELANFLALSVFAGFGGGLKITIIWLLVHVFRNRRRGFEKAGTPSRPPASKPHISF